MLSTISRLTNSYQKQHGYRPNLLYLNTAQLELLKEQISEPDIEIVSQLIGMEIILISDNKKAYVSWAQISWKHSKTA